MKINKLEYNNNINKLENDLYKNINLMHVKDIAIITNVLGNILNKNELFNKRIWFDNAQMITKMKDLCENDSFLLMEINDSCQCLYYFIKTLSNIIDNNNGKNSEYYPIFEIYINEIIRFIDIFNEYCEKYQMKKKKLVIWIHLIMKNVINL